MTFTFSLAFAYGWRSLVGCSPWGPEESDTTERLPFHFSLSCNGEGNGNPLQYSCLENPRDKGAWWAAVYGVTQSRTRLKWLSSSSEPRHLTYVICLILPTTLRRRNCYLHVIQQMRKWAWGDIKIEGKRNWCSTLKSMENVVAVQLLSHIKLFAIPWIAAHQASLSTTNPQSLLKLMSIE